MKRTTLLALVVVTAAVTLSTTGIASATQASHAKWKVWQLDGDRCYDATTMDANFNGNIENSHWDIDNDCKWDARLWNTVGGDGFLETLTFDMNEDGRWELWLVDRDQRDNGFEVVYYDDNGNGKWDRWATIPKRAPDTDLRTILEIMAEEGGRVGGTPQYGPEARLLHDIAKKTNEARWSPADNDNDGTPDDMDPYDRDRCKPYRISGCP